MEETIAAASMVDLAPTPPPGSPSTDCNIWDMAHIGLVVVLVLLATAALFLLHIVGSLRRQSSHGLLHNLVMVVDTLSYPLVSYTIGLMNSRSYCYIDDYAVWAVFMLLLLGSTDNLTVCRLNDVDNWKGIYVKHLFKGLLVVYIVVDITVSQHRGYFPYLAPLLVFLSVGVLKCYVRIASMRMVSKSFLSKKMKVIAEYMEHVDKRGVPLDPVVMEGYNYLVAGEKHCINRPGLGSWYTEDALPALETKIITVEQIGQCPRTLLLHERGNSLKDLCLSMALSKMLNRRFAGFNMSTEELQKTRHLVFNGLLVAGASSHHRAFKIIEKELVFVHDIYYTSYSYLYQKGRYLVLCLPIIMCGVCSWLTCLIIRHHSEPSHLSYSSVIVPVALVLLEGYQVYLYIASGWFKVALIGSYVTTPLLQRSGCSLIIGLLLRLKALRPWEEKLGQYCFLEEICKKNRCRGYLHYATLRLMDKTAKKGHKKSVKLHENVKEAVIDSLLRSDGHLTIGVTSLRRNGIHGRLPAWACDATATDGSVTRRILVWHIATTLCKHQLDGQPNAQGYQIEDMVTTATTLSEYCMHLLAFSPNLLPDHSSISEYILDKVVEKTGNILNGRRKEAWCDRLLTYTIQNGDGGDDEDQLVVHKGIQLAGLLNEENLTLRWEVLSNFWAEMMLYVSPSDNARAHLEALARGGEFITHLWGILKREPTGP